MVQNDFLSSSSTRILFVCFYNITTLNEGLICIGSNQLAPVQGVSGQALGNHFLNWHRLSL